MSLLGKIANKEIYDFLRTTTIKSSYFADQSKSKHIRPSIASRVPDNQIPYYKHIAGEYILKEPVIARVKNPKTGSIIVQTYTNTSKILNSYDLPEVTIENTRIYNDVSGVFDEMMYVTSLDTQEEIPFTLENLHAEYAMEDGATHTKTLEAYKLPSRYYELLCERYPNQVDLIKAIVYPVKKARDVTASELIANANNSAEIPSLTRRRIDALIEEENFAIVNYDETILEVNERNNIIDQMKSLIDIIKTRWNIPEYTYEENYATVLWTMMWSILPLGLIIQRYANIKTPFAHTSHIWGYLISKGLESYKGYLTDDQTRFLYKNIGYILENRGQQKITNLLIDELLADAGLNIKCKTVVLDTTDSLDTKYSTTPPSITRQCETCGRRTTCHRNITEWECNEYLGISGICQAEPIVLTEEFAGANKSKIIEALKSQYGYTEDEAEAKYKRAQLWRDSEIEDIRSQLDRDQLTDLNGETESLDEFIANEHESGLEPIYNEGIVEQQKKELQHIEGTVAPTKILEITKNTYNPRFAALFNKFVTETLLHLAPRDVNGTQSIKVNNIYQIYLNDETELYNFSFGEILALLYLGTLRSNVIELYFDHCNKDEVFSAEHAYFRLNLSTDPEIGKEEAIFMSNGNRMVMMDVSDRIGEPIYDADNVYRWAPKLIDESTCEPGELLPAISGHELLTNFLKNRSFDFPIPDSVMLRNAFKFGKPMKQQQLIDAWYTDNGRASSYLTIMPDETDKALRINDLVYAVKVAFTLSTDKAFLPGKVYYERTNTKDVYAVVTDPEFIPGKDYFTCDLTEEEQKIWDWSPIKLKVLGIIKNEAYFPNNDEIPVIPRFCRWYSEHLRPDSEGMGFTKTVTVLNDLPFDTDAVPTTPTKSEEKLYFDASKSEYYQEIEIDRYIDLDSIISRYTDLMENVTEVSQVGAYIGQMFSIYEEIYTFVGKSGSIRANLAAQAFFDHARCNKRCRFNLTNTTRSTQWPVDGSTKFPFNPASDATTVATYDAWLKFNKNLYDACKSVDKSETWMTDWESINTRIIDALLTGCTAVYWESLKDDDKVQKLKDLMIHLSSYMVNFINIANDGKLGESVATIAMDTSAKVITETSHIYISPIIDSVCPPHCGELCTSIDGYMYAYTRDRVAHEDTIYYKLVANHTTQEYVDIKAIPLDMDICLFEEVKLEPGTEIPPFTYFESLNWFDMLGITTPNTQLEFSRHGSKWYYRLGQPYQDYETVPASALDTEIEGVYDTFLDMGHITQEVRRKLKCVLYRKDIEVKRMSWGSYNYSELLDYWLTNHVIPTYMVNVHTIASDVITGTDSKATIYVSTHGGKHEAYIYRSGVLQEEYIFEEDGDGKKSGPIAGGYVNRHGCLSTCDCGRFGPDAGKQLTISVPMIWDPNLVQDNGAWGNFQTEYWFDPITGEKYLQKEKSIRRFEVDPNTGTIEHSPIGKVGDICPFCKTAVK